MTVQVPDLPAAEYMRVDRFPATVVGESVPNGRLSEVRTVVTDAHLHIFKLSPEGNIDLVATYELDAVELVDGRRERGVRVLTTDGDEIVITRSSGCGCGMTRLKSTRLYPYPVPFTALR